MKFINFHKKPPIFFTVIKVDIKPFIFYRIHIICNLINSEKKDTQYKKNKRQKTRHTPRLNGICRFLYN